MEEEVGGGQRERCTEVLTDTFLRGIKPVLVSAEAHRVPKTAVIAGATGRLVGDDFGMFLFLPHRHRLCSKELCCNAHLCSSEPSFSHVCASSCHSH